MREAGVVEGETSRQDSIVRRAEFGVLGQGALGLERDRNRAAAGMEAALNIPPLAKAKEQEPCHV